MPPGPRPKSKGRNRMQSLWGGAPLTVAQIEQAVMPQTPNGSAVLAWRNAAAQSLDRTLALTTDGEPPELLNAPALSATPSILARNWQGADLRLGNVSNDPATSICIEMFGPGIPGLRSKQLAIGAPLPLAPLHTASGLARKLMELSLKSNSADLTIIAVIAGPMDASGKSAYLFALNYWVEPHPRAMRQRPPATATPINS